MICFFVRQRHTYTLTGWIDYYASQLAGRIRLLAYEDLNGRLPAGTYVFADVERLGPRRARRAARAWKRMHAVGFPLLNHPLHSLRRYDLLRALDNDFRVFRAEERAADLRFPVFLRDENGHEGSLTPLLHSAGELETARRKHPDALLVEFADTSDEEGIYRKYSVFRIGEHLIPRHILFSKEWVVKQPDVVEDRYLEEEAVYLRGNPHAKELRQIFERAGIEYGRIDYSLKDGRIQVWEINTNPTLQTIAVSRFPARTPLQDQVGERINAAFLDLASHEGHRTRRFVRIGWRRASSPWESRFVR